MRPVMRCRATRPCRSSSRSGGTAAAARARELGRDAGRGDEDVGAGDDHADPGALASSSSSVVGLGQVGRARGPVDQGLDQTQLDEHVGAVVARHRLLERPPQEQDRGVRRAAGQRGPGRVAQHLHGAGAAAARCPQEVGGDLLGRRALLAQHAGCPLVVQRPLRRGQVVVHRLADEGMDERQVALLRQDLAPAQGVQRGRDLLLRAAGPAPRRWAARRPRRARRPRAPRP